MVRAVRLVMLLTVCLVAVASCSPRHSLPVPEQIILISLDTLRADMLNYDGYQEYPTSPFLDSFAAQNVVFERAISTEPRTLTSHMSLFTGLLPQHHAVQDDAPLRPEIRTLASALKARGYRTQAFVDGGYLRKRWGFDRGFDGYDDKGTVGRTGFKRILPEATRWLERHADERFFLFLHTYDVHSKGNRPYYRTPPPYHGSFSASLESDLLVDTRADFDARWRLRHIRPSEPDKRFIRASYAEGVRYVDDRLRELFATLDHLGILEDALVIVWSDHGEGLFHHGEWAHAEVFDHTLRVPLIMKIPGLEGAARVRTVVSSVDLAPTILELAGAPHAMEGDGVSLLRFLEKEEPRRLAFSIRTKRGARLFSLRSQSYHLVVDQNAGEEAFFDMANDPGEHRKLSAGDADVPELRSLRRRLSQLIEGYDRDIATDVGGHQTAIDERTRDELRDLGYLE